MFSSPKEWIRKEAAGEGCTPGRRVWTVGIPSLPGGEVMLCEDCLEPGLFSDPTGFVDGVHDQGLEGAMEPECEELDLLQASKARGDDKLVLPDVQEGGKVAVTTHWTRHFQFG